MPEQMIVIHRMPPPRKLVGEARRHVFCAVLGCKWEADIVGPSPAATKRAANKALKEHLATCEPYLAIRAEQSRQLDRWRAERDQPAPVDPLD